jgi:hypothetical protein
MAKPTKSAAAHDASPNRSDTSRGDAKAATAKPRPAVRAQAKRTRPVEKPQAATPVTALPGAGSGTIHLAVRPWGTVYVDGREVGVTPPLKTLRVASGRRLITIRNDAAPMYRREVTVRQDAKTIVRHDFTCVPTREKPCRSPIGK